MIIKYHKKFEKDFVKLNTKQRNHVWHVLTLFENDPFDPVLNNHALKGKEKGKRSISAGGDIRIIFKETGGYTKVLFLRVGTHSELY